LVMTSFSLLNLQIAQLISPACRRRL